MLQYITMCQVIWDNNNEIAPSKSVNGLTEWGKSDVDVCGRKCKHLKNKSDLWIICKCK
jgi:hypothetical protein